MAPVSAPHCGDVRSVPRRVQPIVNGGANPSPLERRVAGPGVTGDQKHDSASRCDRALQPPVDRTPRLVEVEPVQVEHQVGIDRARAKLPVPARIERGPGGRSSRLGERRSRPRLDPGLNRRRRLRLRRRFQRIARERADGRSDPGPQRLLVRAERTHERRSPADRPPWEPAPAPGPWPPSRRQSAAPPRRRPRRCRRGWHP